MTKSTRQAWARFGVVVLGLTLILSASAGCGLFGGDEEAGPGEQALAEQAAKTAEKVEKAIEKTTDIKVETLTEKAPVMPPASSFTYDPINKIDPFSVFSSEIEFPAAGGKDENILTKYEIRYFRLAGIVMDESQPRAIFEDPRGHSYVVYVGTPIGRNLGVVEQIGQDSVIVSEQRFVPGGPTEVETVQLVIKLHPERDKES
ncbi:MAG: pilus assembly protein PilP [Deltaproteobacteria bacterium]|nr:pilus assembly protein PilP [Deltaproteobacteria bacterium]